MTITIDLDAMEALGAAIRDAEMDYGTDNVCGIIRTLHANGWTITRIEPPREADLNATWAATVTEGMRGSATIISHGAGYSSAPKAPCVSAKIVAGCPDPPATRIERGAGYNPSKDRQFPMPDETQF